MQCVTRPEVGKVKPKGWIKYSLQFDYGIVSDCSTMSLSRWDTIFGPSCTEFVYPGCWHFDNSGTSKFVNVLLEHGGLSHVLPLPVYLKFFG